MLYIFIQDIATLTPLIFRLVVHPLAGPLQNLWRSLFQDGDVVHYCWQVYYSTCASGTYTSFSDVAEYLKILSGYIVCPGIREYSSEIGLKMKHLKEWGMPFYLKFSSECSLSHVPNNIHLDPESVVYNCCKPCKQLWHDVHQLQRRAISTTEHCRIERTCSSSNCPISKLSPVSQKLKIAKTTQSVRHYQPTWRPWQNSTVILMRSSIQNFSNWFQISWRINTVRI